VRRGTSVYLGRDPDARFQWNIAAATVLVLAAPLTAGLLTGRTADGLNAALAGWLTAIAVPQPALGARFRQYLIRVVLLEGCTAIGIATGGHLWAVLLSSAVLALCIPVRNFAATPLICLIIAVPGAGSAGPATGSAGEHLTVFAIGCVWAALVMLMPVFGGRYQAATTAQAGDRGFRPTLAWLRPPTPKVRFAVRLCVCFLIAYTAMDLLNVPHASWALVGILTTLRPAWGDTVSRIVKRLVGMAVGCVLAGALLLATRGAPEAVVFAIIVVCGALARPMRGFDYGYWPIFASPVLLLMIEQGTALGPADVALRVVNNALGAALALAAIFLIWPSRADSRITGALTEVLRAHATLFAASAGPGTPSAATGGALERALASQRHVESLAGHLGDRPGRSAIVRELLRIHRMSDQLRERALEPVDEPADEERRRVIAHRLSAHADHLDSGEPKASIPQNEVERSLSETSAILAAATPRTPAAGGRGPA
jgi:uncharacterized membrane protein YccC